MIGRWSRLSIYQCCAHFVELHSLHLVLRNLVKIRIRVIMSVKVRVRVWVRVRVSFRVRSSLGQEFANCACEISKLLSATCKLRSFTNRAQHQHRPTTDANCRQLWQTPAIYQQQPSCPIVRINRLHSPKDRLNNVNKQRNLSYTQPF